MFNDIAKVKFRLDDCGDVVWANLSSDSPVKNVRFFLYPTFIQGCSSDHCYELDFRDWMNVLNKFRSIKNVFGSHNLMDKYVVSPGELFVQFTLLQELFRI